MKKTQWDGVVLGGLLAQVNQVPDPRVRRKPKLLDVWHCKEATSMQFCFYPRHEYACPEVGHCPHLGGAALATVVSVANQSGRDRDLLHLQLAAERASVTRLLAENPALQQQLQQVKLELRLERQSKFMTNRDQRQAHDAAAVVAETAESLAASDTPRKRGAPVGHPGWFRKTPTEFDQTIDVAAPDQCPHCGGTVRGCSWAKPGEHVQEDVVDGVYQVVVYRHSAARCRVCRRWVRQPGEGELLGSRIGLSLGALSRPLMGGSKPAR